jgi:hypothetical protein
MKKIISISVLVLLALSLVACGKKAAEEQGEALSGSIPDLLAKGRSIRCELVAKAQEAIAYGTTYVAQGKFRSDYEMKAEGMPNMKAHSLSDGTWLYSWNDAYPEQASKFKMEDMEKESAQAQSENQGSENYDEQFDYKCYKWQVDESLLAPPAGMEFKDYSDIMKQAEQMQQGSAGAAAGMNIDTSSMCGQCDTLQSAEAKSACKSSLGC